MTSTSVLHSLVAYLLRNRQEDGGVNVLYPRTARVVPGGLSDPQPDFPAVHSYNIETDDMEWVECSDPLVLRTWLRADPNYRVSDKARNLVEDMLAA